MQITEIKYHKTSKNNKLEPLGVKIEKMEYFIAYSTINGENVFAIITRFAGEYDVWLNEDIDLKKSAMIKIEDDESLIKIDRLINDYVINHKYDENKIKEIEKIFEKNIKSLQNGN
jgi:hypothetical protein